MDNSIYITLSKQLGLFRDMDVTANNIANATTAGYTSEDMLFTDYLVGDGNKNKMAFSQDISTYRDTRQGALKATGNPLDIAISGKGYFTVETPLGVRYTRAGNFQLDGGGVLVTMDGYPVLDADGQRIQFEEEDREITVGEAGNLTVDGEERGILGVVQFENEQLLERLSSTLFKSEVPGAQAEEGAVRVMHGMLESSNVDPITQMTHMIKVSRSVASTAKFIETMYDLERKASNAYTRQS